MSETKLNPPTPDEAAALAEEAQAKADADAAAQAVDQAKADADAEAQAKAALQAKADAEAATKATADAEAAAQAADSVQERFDRYELLNTLLKVVETGNNDILRDDLIKKLKRHHDLTSADGILTLADIRVAMDGSMARGLAEWCMKARRQIMDMAV